MSNSVPPQGAAPTVDGFLKTVLRSGLVNREQLQSAVRSVPRGRRDDAAAVADHLVEGGTLSRFQANKLLQGTARGLVLGPFQVLTPIGKGGMGNVYLARDTRSEQMLALKVLSPKRAKEEDRILARFRREMEMCQAVAHPHLAWTYDVGVCQGVYYIAMEYIPGKSLYRTVVEHGPLDHRRAARVFAEIAAALDHAHHQGLIHRDIKPSNVILTPNDHAKVLDLGLALRAGERDGRACREVVGGAGYVVGTMDYLAPEQAEDACRVDARSDVYSLGCTLYFALTGRPPFPGGTAREKIQRHRGEEPAPLGPEVPAEFAELVLRMMAKKPEQRPGSAHEVEEALRQWAGSDPGLPLDRPEDRLYAEAVAVLEAEEPSSDLEEEALPEVDPPPLATAVLVEEQIPAGKLVSVSGSRPKRRPPIRLPAPVPPGAARAAAVPDGWVVTLAFCGLLALVFSLGVLCLLLYLLLP